MSINDCKYHFTENGMSEHDSRIATETLEKVLEIMGAKRLNYFVPYSETNSGYGVAWNDLKETVKEIKSGRT